MVLEALKKKYLGEILLEEKYVTKEQLDESLKESIDNKEQLGQVLIRKGYITEDNLLNSLSISLGIEYRRLANMQIVQSVLGFIPEKVARKYLAVPLDIKNEILVVAMADPANVVYKDDVQKLTGRRISVVLSSESDIKEFIEKYYVRTSLSAEIGEDEINNERKQDEIEDDFSGDNADSAPVIKYVNSIFFDAITKKASDIHLEPFEKEVSLRMRIDGVLIVFPAPQKKYYAAIVSRIKIMSELDIAERRLPQDGKCRIKISNYKVDIRVSILPTIWGEKVVLRILAKGTTSLSIDGIGFAPKELNFFKEAIAAPYGMVLVTGPTSSGKTTTLYSALNDINKDDINIVTAEDPVEYELRGINQVHVRSDIGLDFAAILRTFMRQDPDVILVGEIRDKETAQIAIQAALTGHLVFSTLHTNDTVSTIARMSFMGVESFLLADAVNLIIAQRLIRTICTACKKEVLDLDDSVYKKLGIDRSVKVYKGKGCRQCDGSGYKGRTAIFEMLNISSAIKKAIMANAGDTAIREIAKKEGIVTLRESAMIKLKEGRTTIEEVLSVTLKVE